MIKLLYSCGMLAFAISFFVPTLPDEMTGPEGKDVKMWDPPGLTHFRLAVEPFAQLVDCMTYKQDPGDHGDGPEEYRAERIRRSLFTLPVSCAWFGILASVPIMTLAWTLRITKSRVRLGLQAIGGIVLLAVPFLVVDFYRDATVYRGYFHLGAGGYLIVSACLLVGASFIVQFNKTEVPNKVSEATSPEGTTPQN